MSVSIDVMASTIYRKTLTFITYLMNKYKHLNATSYIQQKSIIRKTECLCGSTLKGIREKYNDDC